MSDETFAHEKYSDMHSFLPLRTLQLTPVSIWRSGCCYLNKGECNLNQSTDDSFVKRLAKNNNSWNNDDRHKIHQFFLINCFVFVIIPVWKTVHSWEMTQIKAHLMEKTLQLTIPKWVPVLAGWTKKPFGNYAILKLFPSDHQVDK